MEYIINGKKLIWDCDGANGNVNKLIKNNLYIDGIWNMLDTVGYIDTCVSVSQLSEDSFYFVTFCGLGFTMKVFENKVECIKRQITK